MTPKVTRIFVFVVLLTGGLWLIFSSPRPALESAARQQAMLQAFAANEQGNSQGAGTLNAQAIPETQLVEGVSVDLSQIPAGVYDPNNQYDRWLRGEIDLDEHEMLLPQAEIARLQEEASRLRPGGNLQVAPPGPEPLAPVLGVGFDSLDYTDCCGGGGSVPPDPELAVGPNHVIAVVNRAFEIYNKSGTRLVGPTTYSSFFAADSRCGNGFDPNVLYDEEANRYLIGIDANGSYYCLAVSQSGNPTTTWRLYAFQTGSGFNSANFFDYPHAGVGRTAIYMGANMFNCSGGCSFTGSKIWAFDKNAMYNGQTAASAVKTLASGEASPQPLHLHGFSQGTWPTSGLHYFFTDTNYNGETYSVWSWNNPFNGQSPTRVGTVNLESYTGVSSGYPLSFPQQGGQSIQGNDYRPHDFEYRNGHAWAVQTVSCNPGGGTVNCIRWARINPATASIVDAGVFSSNGQYRSFPNLAVNHCNDMSVGYTKSSSGMFPSVWFTGRKSSTAPGTLQAEAQLKAGEIVYTAFDGAPHRWGDYTGMTIAPDGVTFWYLGEYSKNTGTSSGRWGTYIGSFTYSGCDGGGGEPTPTPTPPPAQDGLYVTTRANQRLGNLRVRQEDIARYNTSTGRWEMHFDGSDVSLTVGVVGFAFMPNDDILLTVRSTKNLPGVGALDLRDVIRFTPTALGANTAGSFSIHLDGTDVGLDVDTETLDGVGFAPDGRLLISPANGATVPATGGGQLTAQDEDVLVFNATSFGANTAGTWALYFDGSDVGLADYDVWDVAVHANGDVYLTLETTFSVGGVSGDAADIIRCAGGTRGTNTTCNQLTLYWDGSAYGVNANYGIDGFELSN